MKNAKEEMKRVIAEMEEMKEELLIDEIDRKYCRCIWARMTKEEAERFSKDEYLISIKRVPKEGDWMCHFYDLESWKEEDINKIWYKNL